jgi:hypothetical protein
VSTTPSGPPYDEFRAAAQTAAAARPGADLELALEVYREAATMLHDSLALDGLDDHDRAAVVAALGTDLAADDPGAAVRDRAGAAVEHPGDLHDPAAVEAAYLVSAQVLQL